MPELPEVEIARRTLERWLGGSEVTGAEAERTRVFRAGGRADFGRLRGRLARADRHGKVLLISLDSGQGFLSHLGMTGKWVRRGAGETVPYSRARLTLSDGTVVHYRDTRLFGRIEPHPADALPNLPGVQALGPDPLLTPLSGRQLRDALGATRAPIKVALMDQRRLAGLGNIHAAEALWRARLHPSRPTRSLELPEWRRLATAIRRGLAFALAAEDAEEIAYVEEPGTENPFKVYAREGEPCPRCGTPIRLLRQAGRRTDLCPHCQPVRRARR
ncbi:MAG TPA: bifunctional DNA-formamidopyrimidine glycosylase/DNA-(apurinic or apyrimidinic site) lyase [Myxococcaceae bacterium]|nr:bifunctional DNA-formamidopyrimidine glycosylase/DNA-(apurinic or apyrimidinic site) lyase [Myxococcaceae bacterium]